MSEEGRIVDVGARANPSKLKNRERQLEEEARLAALRVLQLRYVESNLSGGCGDELSKGKKVEGEAPRPSMRRKRRVIGEEREANDRNSRNRERPD